MEKLTDLGRVRNERIELLKHWVLDVAREHILTRNDGDFDVTLGKVDLNLIELYVTRNDAESAFTSAPQYVLNETAIALANRLAEEQKIPYTVDMSQIASDTPHIRVVKM